MGSKKIFENIAFAYQWFFNYQVKVYKRVIEKNRVYLGVDRGDSIIDLGCGTGAFSYALKEKGYRVTGIDAAGAMVEKGRANGVDCLSGNVVQGLPFPDSNFDLVIAAFVVHGLDPADRKDFYREASRLTGGRVIFHDYNQKRRRFIDFIEYLEGGNYFSFIKNGLAEMKEVFSSVEEKPVGDWNSWYICHP